MDLKEDITKKEARRKNYLQTATKDSRCLNVQKIDTKLDKEYNHAGCYDTECKEKDGKQFIEIKIYGGGETFKCHNEGEIVQFN